MLLLLKKEFNKTIKATKYIETENRSNMETTSTLNFHIDFRTKITGHVGHTLSDIFSY